MNALAVAVVVGCVAVISAQTPTFNMAGSGTSGGLGSSPTGSGSSLDAMVSNILGGSGSSGSILDTTAQDPTTATTSTNASPMNQMFSSPIMAMALTDSFRRAMTLPFLSRMGGSNTANYYYARGGLDDYMKVRMADMMGKMFGQGMGMNPFLGRIFASQMLDAPDRYPMYSMLFGGMGNNGANTGATSAAGSQSSAGMSSLGPLALLSMAM